MSSVRASPDSLAEAPSTDWRNSGANMIFPNMATPTAKPARLAALERAVAKEDDRLAHPRLPPSEGREQPGARGEQPVDLDRPQG